MSTAARFVVIEGGDAVGKSTQVRLLAARLRAIGHDALESFEPGATTLGAALRALVLDGQVTVDPIAEALLMAADRAEHVSEVIGPALASGVWVVSDRFVPSSLAYQGVGRGLGVAEIEQLNALATGGLEPDLVIVLDLPGAIARERMGATRDRLEDEDDAFVLAVHEAYHDLAQARGWELVDASGAADHVADTIWRAVNERLLS